MYVNPRFYIEISTFIKTAIFFKILNELKVYISMKALIYQVNTNMFKCNLIHSVTSYLYIQIWANVM